MLFPATGGKVPGTFAQGGETAKDLRVLVLSLELLGWGEMLILYFMCLYFLTSVNQVLSLSC